MKKIILALVAVLGFAALSNAQPIKARFVDANPDNPEKWAEFSSIDLHDDGTCSMRQDHFRFQGTYNIDRYEDYPGMEPGKVYDFVMVWISDLTVPHSATGHVMLNSESGMLTLTIGKDEYIQEEETE